jgi:catechol 2,3-dioxygenase-like lactoylglutathione lyase family enzyme
VTIEGLTSLSRRDIHHVAFDVADVTDAIKFFGAAFGVGPFFRLLNAHGNDPNHIGPGFGYLGGIYVELIGADGVTPGGPRLNHIAYMTTEPEKESARLVELGLPKTREFRVGDVWPQFHDASHQIGCAIEIHNACLDLDEFFLMVAQSSQGWDGRDPERVTPSPGTQSRQRSAASSETRGSESRGFSA